MALASIGGDGSGELHGGTILKQVLKRRSQR